MLRIPLAFRQPVVAETSLVSSTTAISIWIRQRLLRPSPRFQVLIAKPWRGTMLPRTPKISFVKLAPIPTIGLSSQQCEPELALTQFPSRSSTSLYVLRSIVILTRRTCLPSSSVPVSWCLPRSVSTSAPLAHHAIQFIHSFIHSLIHSFIRSYPVSSRQLIQSPLLGPNHLCWCPSLSVQSRGRERNSDITDSTHPVCRKKPQQSQVGRQHAWIKTACRRR